MGIAPAASLGAPEVITLEAIWAAIMQLRDELALWMNSLATQVSTNMDVIQGNVVKISSLQIEVSDFHTKMVTVENDMDFLKKSTIPMKFKLEMLENTTRAVNIRMVNFPRVALVSARDMFRSYLIENLGIPPESHPPIAKMYYLPLGKKIEGSGVVAGVTNVDVLDVTAMLESSQDERVIPSTLFITLALLSDKNGL